MDEFSESMRDVLGKKNGTTSDIDYCVSKGSKGSSGGKSYHNDETGFDNWKTRYSKLAGARLNSLELIVDQNIPPLSLSSNNSPNRNQEEIKGRPHLFPSSTRLHTEIKFPDQLSEVLSKSEHTESTPRSEYHMLKQEEARSGTGSPVSNPVPCNGISPERLSSSATSDDDRCIYGRSGSYNHIEKASETSHSRHRHMDYYGLEYRLQLNGDQISATNQSDIVPGNTSSAMTSENQVSAPSFLVMTDQHSVSKRIEQVLLTKKYISKPEDYSKEDVVTKIEGVLHKVESYGRLKQVRMRAESIEIEQMQSKQPTPVPSPLLPARELGAFGSTQEGIATIPGNFNKKSQGSRMQSAEQKDIQEINENDIKSRTDQPHRIVKKRDSLSIRNLISICNEKLGKFRKSRSPLDTSKMRSTSNSNSVMDTLMNARKKLESSITIPLQTTSRDASPTKNTPLQTDKYFMRVKRLSILQRDSVPSSPSKLRGSPLKESAKSPSAQNNQMIGYLKAYLNSKQGNHRILHPSKQKLGVSQNIYGNDLSSSSIIKGNSSLGEIALKYKTKPRATGTQGSLWNSKEGQDILDKKSRYSEYQIQSKELLIELGKMSGTPKLIKNISSKIAR